MIPDVDAVTSLVLRSTILLAAGLGVAKCIRGAGAATRHAVLLASAMAVLALPVAMAFPIAVPLSVGWMARGGSATTAVSGTRARWPAGLRAATRPAGPLAAGPLQRRDSAVRGNAAVVVLVIWLLGVSFNLFRLIRSLRGVQRLVGASRIASINLADALGGFAGDRPLPSVIVRCSTLATSPAVAGVFRMRIIVPLAAQSWSPATLRSVLLHECAHIARRDTLTQLLTRCMCAIHWYNPLAWIVSRQQETEAEFACDATVVGAGVEADVYATALVSVARASTPAPWRAALAPMSLQGTALEQRVRAILEQRASHRFDPIRKLLVLLSSAGAFVLVGATHVSAAAPMRQAAAPGRLPMEPDQRHDSVAAPLSERIPPQAVWQSRVQHGVPALLAGADSAFVRRLVAALDHRPTFSGDLVGERALWTLAQSDGATIVAPLIERLHSPDWRERAYAAWALAAVPDQRPVAALVVALRDPVWRVRGNAAAALAASADPDARTAMLTALDDEAWQVRSEAVRYLVRMGNPADRPRLEQARFDRHVAVRSALEESPPHLH